MQSDYESVRRTFNTIREVSASLLGLTSLYAAESREDSNFKVLNNPFDLLQSLIGKRLCVSSSLLRLRFGQQPDPGRH